MTTHATTNSTSIYDIYAGSPPQNYERYFVPVIGEPSARPLIDAAQLRPGERVLDIACGTGVATRMAAAAVGAGGNVLGIDANPGMLEVARTAAPVDAPIEWRLGEAQDLPVDDAAFDAVVCSLGFQFFVDKPEALHQMRRALVPGGRAVLGTPGPTPPLFQEIEDALAQHFGPQGAMFVRVVFSVHDPDEVVQQLTAAGFADPDVEVVALDLELPPAAHFFWQYVRSTPLALAAGELGEDARAALEADVVARCAPFERDGALRLQVPLLVASGRRGE